MQRHTPNQRRLLASNKGVDPSPRVGRTYSWAHHWIRFSPSQNHGPAFRGVGVTIQAKKALFLAESKETHHHKAPRWIRKVWQWWRQRFRISNEEQRGGRRKYMCGWEFQKLPFKMHAPIITSVKSGGGWLGLLKKNHDRGNMFLGKFGSFGFDLLECMVTHLKGSKKKASD